MWFSEEDIPLGSLMTREIDKGLRNSRIGIVLVTRALLKSIRNEGIAEQELAVLLNSRRVVPVTHGVTFDELYDASPTLMSHAGLSTAETSLEDFGRQDRRHSCCAAGNLASYTTACFGSATPLLLVMSVLARNSADSQAIIS